jgi:predicted RecB family nuclease
MKISSSNIYSLYAPTFCEKRLYYRFKEEKEADKGPFQELIIKLGKRFEETSVKQLGKYLDLSEGEWDQRVKDTRKAIANDEPIIYQALFEIKEDFDGQTVNIQGSPDILLNESGGYVIRDYKLSRHAEDKKSEHPEIIFQLQLYGYLFEKTTGTKPIRLEAFLGDGTSKTFIYDNGTTARLKIREILDIYKLKTAPYSPVGWSKCTECGFKAICFDIAEKNNDVALVYDLDQGLARQLRAERVSNIDELLDTYTEATLSELKRPWGAKMQKVGVKAKSILLHAQALKKGKNIKIGPVEMPLFDNYVMFDLEGLPPNIDEIEKIYLWGMQVYGKTPSAFRPAVAPMGIEGDRKGWKEFLNIADSIFKEYGDIPFVHWHSYEKTKINLYLERYGDIDGIAQRVLNNLLDLLPVTKKAMVLCEPSYSLKVVEQVAGFKRTQDEFGGSWSIAKYIEAVETEDETLRKEKIDEILKYNEEDLAATWAVYQWLKEQ